MLLHSSCLILLFHTVSFEGQTILMYENNQEDNVTNCTFGLVSDINTVVFKAKVDYSQDANIKLVYFQLRKKSELEYWFIEGIDVKEHCNGTTAEKISCVHINNRIVLITIRMVAKREHSVGRIRGVIITSNSQQITSDAQNLPQITNSTDINGTLFIDGVEVARTNNSYFVTTIGPEVNFKFECESKVSPCLIEISGTGLMNPVKGKSHVSHTFRQQQLNITIKQALCTLDRQAVTFYCIIKTNSNSTTDQVINHNWYFAFLGFIPFVFCIILMVKRKRSHHQLCRAGQDKKQSRDSERSDHGCQASLLNKNISGEHVHRVIENTDLRGSMVTMEMKELILDKIGDIARRKKTDDDVGDTRFPAENKEHNLFQNIFDSKKSDYFYDIKKLELIPKPDDVFPLPDQTREMDFKMKNDISLSVKLLTEKESNEDCKCRKCQDSLIKGTTCVHLILIQHDLDKNVSKYVSNEHGKSIRNIDSKSFLENKHKGK